MCSIAHRESQFLSTIMDVYFYRLGIFFQSIFDVNSQVTWDTKLVTYIAGPYSELTFVNGQYHI